MTQYELLRRYYGHSAFRNGQESIINALLSQRDVLCVMPTGAGKSICYQIPALMSSGITLVISPLISLMKDQVSALIQMGIHAAYINSSLTYSQCRTALSRAAGGAYKIIYVAPERLLTEDFNFFVSQAEISFIAVDEAHCVSQWGQDFRPSYLKIAEFINSLPSRPVVGAFTATATVQVKQDIVTLLCLNSPLEVTTGFDRPNLHFSVMHKPDKNLELMRLMKRFSDKSGIIYCSTRKTVEAVCDLLCSNGYNATRYHAGLSDNERKNNQEAFVFDKCKIMVATNAFGMGIDKSNVSYVIHYNMPKSMESYYQEAGRAGRDGEKAYCVLLYSGSDVRTNLFLIDNSEANPDIDPYLYEKIKEKDRERLKLMTFYSTTNDCLRAFILRYFGESTEDYCGNCSSCETHFTETDVSVQAQSIIKCIMELNRSYGKKMIMDILRGSHSERIMAYGLNNASSYGQMADISEKKLRAIIDYLISAHYLSADNSEYPVITITASARQILNGKKISMKILADTNTKALASPQQEINSELFAKLKELRTNIASGKSVPSYIIFTDAALREMCVKMPRNSSEFMNISGVGEVKCRTYGNAFTKCINDYIADNE